MPTLPRKSTSERPADLAVGQKDLPDLTDLRGGNWFTARDGWEIYWKAWKPETTVVANVIAIHGFGEHINRYDPLFSFFASKGIAVRGIDQRGHGRTHFKNLERGSLQGFMGTFKNTFEDLLQLNEMDIDGLPKKGEVPTFVFGHSMGGLIALSLVNLHAQRIPNFRGIVVQAPCIRTVRSFPSLVSSTISTLGTSFFPRYQAPSGAMELNNILDPSLHDEYSKDPYNHNFMTLRLLRDFITYGRKVEGTASAFSHPVLLYHSRIDKLTSCEASELFIKNAIAEDKTVKFFDNARHELHFESELRDQVATDYAEWILARSTATPPLPAKTPAGALPATVEVVTQAAVVAPVSTDDDTKSPDVDADVTKTPAVEETATDAVPAVPAKEIDESKVAPPTPAEKVEAKDLPQIPVESS
ncbi:hypothetical protein SpCBS45565_g07144 [Spizellomyces sp. 'palustris']|nr:hypothetical protein SpCBS45565_g07144 [Spizellomyces sp. 'palustris']